MCRSRPAMSQSCSLISPACSKRRWAERSRYLMETKCEVKINHLAMMRLVSLAACRRVDLLSFFGSLTFSILYIYYIYNILSVIYYVPHTVYCWRWNKCVQDSQLSCTEHETHIVESDLRRSGKQRNRAAKNCGMSVSDKCDMCVTKNKETKVNDRKCEKCSARNVRLLQNEQMWVTSVSVCACVCVWVGNND